MLVVLFSVCVCVCASSVSGPPFVESADGDVRKLLILTVLVSVTSMKRGISSWFWIRVSALQRFYSPSHTAVHVRRLPADHSTLVQSSSRPHCRLNCTLGPSITAQVIAQIIVTCIVLEVSGCIVYGRERVAEESACYAEERRSIAHGR